MAGKLGILVAGGLRLRLGLGDGASASSICPGGQRNLRLRRGHIGLRRGDLGGGRAGAQLCQRGFRFRHVGRRAIHLGRGNVVCRVPAADRPRSPCRLPPRGCGGRCRFAPGSSPAKVTGSRLPDAQITLSRLSAWGVGVGSAPGRPVPGIRPCSPNRPRRQSRRYSDHDDASHRTPTVLCLAPDDS